MERKYLTGNSQEWNIKMLLSIRNGRKFAEFSKSNLHIVGYSIPVNRKISKRTSKTYLHSKRSTQLNSICNKLL